MKTKSYFIKLIFGLLLFSVISCQAISKKSGSKLSGSWDFFDGKLPEKWQPKSDTWKVKNGKIVSDDKKCLPGMLVYDSCPVSDFNIEADIKINKEYLKTNSTWAGFHFRSDMPLQELPWNSGYLVILYSHGAVTALCMNGEMKAGGTFTPLPNNKPNNLRVKMIGPLMQIFVNGKKIVEQKNEKYKNGYVSLINFGNEVSFDNIKFKGRKASLKSSTRQSMTIKPIIKPHVNPLPKITVKRGKGNPGHFVYKKTGKVFVPDGYNHTIGDNANEKIPHATFNVGTYDSKRIDKVLAEMKALGANTVRVWLWGTDHGGNGIWGGPDSESLNKEYMENFCDFLRLATKHGIYVVPILDLKPANAKYKAIAKKRVKSADKKVTDHNCDILLQGFIDARKQAARDTIRFVKAADPNLLNAILGWSLANEICLISLDGPFNLDKGIVKVANGNSYDMADFNSRQKCADESFLYWANQLADVVHEEDPNGLVTIGMWTSDAHDRPPVNGIQVSKHPDTRFPPRPSVFASPKSKIDFLDIHVYPWMNKFLINPEAHELKATSKFGLPVLVGEYGVFIHQATNNIDGANKVVELRKNCYEAGYAGALHWVWNYTNGLYNGEYTEVRKALSEARKKQK